MKRRDFLKLAGAAAGGVVSGWPLPGRAGVLLTTDDEVAHILPTVSHDRMLVKVSFFEPQTPSPLLRVNGSPVAGSQTDSDGRFWQFDLTGLSADTTYELELEKNGSGIFEPWDLKTFPSPGSMPSQFRLLVYTCAGGNDIFALYVPLQIRQRLLRRGLSFQPDAVLAVGDHVYWDLRTIGGLFLGNSATAHDFAGTFDRMQAVLGTSNERVLRRAVDYQIAGLYGTIFRSVPVFFARDDHDYFEDDRVTQTLTTFPADPFMFDLARSTQRLYYPEFLPDAGRPLTLPDSAAADRPPGVSETSGTIRYGKLVEALIYDCKGYLTLDGPSGLFIPADVESWLVARMATSDAAHVVNVPSNPMGYSAGKFAEWYPDVVVDGELTTAVPKAGWQEGWLPQHDRILQAAHARGGIPLVVSGDIHSVAEEKIMQSGALDFSSNPIVSLISGTPATGAIGFPSVIRGVLAQAPEAITAETVVPTEEINGFHIIEFEPDTIRIKHFRWDIDTQPPEAIDTLTPFHESVYTTA